jgi:anti-sigma-K factor RskA
MTDTDDMDDIQALAAEYALGLLSPAEATAFEDLLASDPDVRAFYARWAEDFAAITDGIAPVAPPANLQARIEADLFPQSARKTPTLLERLGLIPAMLTGLVAAVTLMVVVDLGIMAPPEGPDFNPVYAAEVAAPDQSLVVYARFDPSVGLLRLERAAGAPREGRALELWLIAGDNAPVSLGVLPADETTEVQVPEALLAAMQDGVLAISDEPPGGSPTGAPTGDVLATGPVTLL